MNDVTEIVKKYTNQAAYLQIRARRYGRTLDMMKVFWDHYYTMPSAKQFKGTEYLSIMANKYRSCMRKVLKQYIGLQRMQECSLRKIIREEK